MPSTGGRRRKEQSYRSVISGVFNGSVLSLVQCLTCDRVGTQGSWHCLPCGAGWTLPWHSYPRSKLSASPAGAVDTGKGGHQAGLHPIGIYHSGDIPGPVVAHPWQGRPSQTHSAIYQNVPTKPGACGDSYSSQGWLAFIVEYIRRYAGTSAGLTFLGLPAVQEQASMGPGRVHGSGAGGQRGRLG